MLLLFFTYRFLCKLLTREAIMEEAKNLEKVILLILQTPLHYPFR